ncbi:MAG: hypothetical protein WC217_01255 [Candidatus Paceibacterota bacterium]
MKARYAAKRHTSKWKNRKRSRIAVSYSVFREKRRRAQQPFIRLVAPKQFSLISNTNEVLKYFESAERMFAKGENVGFDISEVEILTADAIALLVASIKDSDFTHGGNYRGTAPAKPELNKLFMESGFLEHVRHDWNDAHINKENLLHKEDNFKVSPKIAKSASLTGIRHVSQNSRPFEALYEILIECMSNTNNHADLSSAGKCKWWIYVYSNPNEKVSSYSFVDVGVGIFKSAVIQDKIKQRLKGTVLYPNIKLVPELLSGKLQSRIDKDNALRGKGIPQIIDHSKSPRFRSFYIITNDVRIDLKTGTSEQLNHNLNGTFLHWELVK